jgi:hypothetical protein
MATPCTGGLRVLFVRISPKLHPQLTTDYFQFSRLMVIRNIWTLSLCYTQFKGITADLNAFGRTGEQCSYSPLIYTFRSTSGTLKIPDFRLPACQFRVISCEICGA